MRENPTQPAGARPSAADRSRPSARASAMPHRRARDASGRTMTGSIPAARPSRQTAGKGAAAKDNLTKKATDLRAFAMRFKVALIVLAAVLVVVVALYAPAQQYYTAWRTNGVLEAQKAQEDAENQELQADNDSLMSLEGIEERAREKGYVNEGETALKVEGLPAEEDSSDQEEAPQEALPWYLSVGDFIFQYQEPEAL